MKVRPATAADLPRVGELAHALWPDGSPAEQAAELGRWLEAGAVGGLPWTLLVVEVEGVVEGFLEVDLRSHADGCDPARPTGYLEGWYVSPAHRRSGLGRALVAAGEAWARSQGCLELASDTWLDNPLSQRAHAALGFEVVDRCVHFRKALGPAPAPPVEGHYGPALARLHHRHFGDTAREAAGVLLQALRAAGLTAGTVVDLATGPGLLARAALEAGYRVHAVDVSEAMLALARQEAPGASFERGSLWQVTLPRCVGLAAVGEALSYAVDPAAGAQGLGARLEDFHRALEPGGVLLLDLAGPGRAGPGGERRRFWSLEGVHLGLVEREEPSGQALSRELTLFLPQGGGYRREVEHHRLVLLAPEAVEAALARAGFEARRLPGYGPSPLPPGWQAWVATRR